MSRWAVRRQLAYSGTLLLFLVVVLSVPVYFYFFSRPASCFDTKQNQNEQGVDCGGVCQKLCPFQAVAPSVLWSRIFPVAGGIYSAVAYIENPNPNAYVPSIDYTFKIYDDQNVLLLERKGKTSIPPQSAFPVFESGIAIAKRSPTRAYFEFTGTPVWLSKTDEVPVLSVSQTKLTNEESAPRIESNIENPTLLPITNIEVVAIAFDIDDNALGVSRTVIDRLEKKSTVKVVFTWPQPFSKKIDRIVVTPKPPLR